jgi:hypothetical protein
MSTLSTYRVSLKEYPGDKFTIVFDCWAEDSDHSEEQAQDAYPAGVITHIMPIPEQDYMTQTPYSHGDRQGDINLD